METNKLIRTWIWFWYNDITRICILFGLLVIPVSIIVEFIFGSGEYLKGVSLVIYFLFVLWTFIDNDYSNLRRIGLTEYRKKILKSKNQEN